MQLSKCSKKLELTNWKESNNFANTQPELTSKEKEKRNIKEWKKFINEKGWNLEFGLKLENKTLEEIKKKLMPNAINLILSILTKRLFPI